MFKKLVGFIFVALTGIFSVAPALAQNSISQIDSEHSTARLYLVSSKDPSDSVNVGVARAAGVVKLSAGNSAAPDFDFTIYPADQKSSLAGSEAGRRGETPDYTVISFKSRRVVPLATDTFRVSGALTTTYVHRDASYDPSESFSGPTYGPSITHSENREVTFEFHKVTASRNSGSGEWTASATVLGEDSPGLLNAVSSTDWPVFVADEHCAMPSNVGEDFSGPTCTGERVDVAARKDLHCEAPPTVGEDFAGEVCTQADPFLITDPGQTLSASRHHKNADSGRLVANEVRIQLDLLTTSSTPAVSMASGQ
ncbi:MAG TPA: hypothetical protein VNY24_05190 [Candidatus Acidoferrales bacterium]|jgi:hypothetical protein|nr:hypothetical protein [Candidatus Acidoferrales bacterium]